MGGISSEAQTVVRPSTLLVQSRGAAFAFHLSPFHQKPINHHHHFTARIEVDCQLDTAKGLASACKHSSRSLGRFLPTHQLSNRRHIAATFASEPFPAINHSLPAHNLCIPASRTKNTEKGWSVWGLEGRKYYAPPPPPPTAILGRRFSDGWLEG